jgi:hypothetical protein
VSPPLISTSPYRNCILISRPGWKSASNELSQAPVKVWAKDAAVRLVAMALESITLARHVRFRQIVGQKIVAQASACSVDTFVDAWMEFIPHPLFERHESVNRRQQPVRLSAEDHRLQKPFLAGMRLLFQREPDIEVTCQQAVARSRGCGKSRPRRRHESVDAAS